MVGKISEIDKRHTPRIKVDPPIKISGDINAKLLNINDGGICFSISTPLRVKKCMLIIDFPSRPVKIHVEIKWNGKSGDEHEFLYGASMINPNKDILTIVRRYMISKQFKFVIRHIKNKNTRKHLLKFAKAFRNYLFGLIDLTNLLEAKKIKENELQEKLKKMNNDIVQRGEELKNMINNKLIIKKLKQEFRMLVSCWAFKSQIIKRGFDKPRGYPGDSDTLEIIYDKTIFSHKNDLGCYFDIYFLDNPYAEAVRNRKNTLCDILRKILLEQNKKMKILNLASGSCREIWELYKRNKNINKVETEFILLDWDEHALEFSRNRLSNITKNAKFDFIKEDIMQFVKSTEFFNKKGKQDLIYSIGLADYLPDRVLKKMIKNSFDGLNTNGKFIIAHKDKDISFSHLPPEWFCDWEFISRNEKDMLNLIKETILQKFSYDIIREKSGQIFFITVTKE